MPAAWLYDDHGSDLFEQITELEEYYPTRVELGLLRDHSRGIAERTHATAIVELGSGASPKTHALIEGFAAVGLLDGFTAVDVNADAARRAVEALRGSHPGIAFGWQAGDFMRDVGALSADGPAMLAFLGSTIGNLTVTERAGFLRGVAAALRPGDWFLLGIDLVKEPARILAAYDDRLGLTADFILNVVPHVNELADADLDPLAFAYEPSWNAELERIEMRIRAERDLRVTVAGIPAHVPVGTRLFVEISTKFRVDRMAAELAQVGLIAIDAWTDADPGRQEPDFALLLCCREA